MKILALDLGKFKSVACVYDTHCLQHRFETVATSAQALHDLLVEHEPVITLGRTTQASSLPLTAEAIRRQGVGVHEVERGGDVTWHGPGQLVGYPILDLRRMREDLHWYLRSLEDALIDALESIGIPADRNPGYTGVWTAGRKIASIGVHVKRWVTLHGFALNVVNDLSGFDLIVPCGIQQVVMTSVAAELGDGDASGQLFTRTREAVVSSLGKALEREPLWNQPVSSGVSLA